MQYFTPEKIIDLVVNYNWVLQTDGGRFFLSQKDKPYMKTVYFELTPEENQAVYDGLKVSL